MQKIGLIQSEEDAIRLLRRAVARGTRIRLRSILLTSLTTIIGLAPLLIQFGNITGHDIWDKLASLFQFRGAENKDIWYNLALASIGGLASSTVLLILAMPPLYYLCVRLRWLLSEFGAWLRRRLAPSQ